MKQKQRYEKEVYQKEWHNRIALHHADGKTAGQSAVVENDSWSPRPDQEVLSTPSGAVAYCVLRRR